MTRLWLVSSDVTGERDGDWGYSGSPLPFMGGEIGEASGLGGLVERWPDNLHPLSGDTASPIHREFCKVLGFV